MRSNFDASEINEVNLPSSSRKKNSPQGIKHLVLRWLSSLHEIEKKSGERHEYARSSRQSAKNGNHSGRDERVAQSDCESRLRDLSATRFFDWTRPRRLVGCGAGIGLEACRRNTGERQPIYHPGRYRWYRAR